MPKWFDDFIREGKTLLKKGKDIFVSSHLTSFLINRTRINRYGKLLNLKLNSFHKEVSFSLKLLDEDSTIDVKLNYENKVIDSEYMLIITAASISREWMNSIVQRYFINKKFPVPKELYTFLN